MITHHSRSWTVNVVALLVSATASLGAQTLQTLEMTPGNDRRVEVFVDGNLRNVVSQPSDVVSATGSLGMQYRGPTYLATGLINIAGKSDTVTAGLGATLLAPSAGKALNAGLLDIRRRLIPFLESDCKTAKLRNKVRCHLGLHGYASIASWRWATTTGADGAALTAEDVPVWGSGLGLSYTFFDGTIGDSTTRDSRSVAMVLDAGLATRHVRGDLFNQDTLRTRLLGDDQKNFAGLELGLNLQYGELRAGLTYYFMNGDVRGFSNGQVVAGVSVQANLTGGPLGPNTAAAPRSPPADSTQAPAPDQ